MSNQVLFINGLLNHIFEYSEGNTISLNEKNNPRYSNLRLVNKLWNDTILKKWKIKYETINTIDNVIYQIEKVLECGNCDGCMCFHLGTSGGENQMAHYGGCFPEEFESEDEFQVRINNLQIGNTKYVDYQSKKRDREEDFMEGRLNKRCCPLY